MAKINASFESRVNSIKCEISIKNRTYREMHQCQHMCNVKQAKRMLLLPHSQHTVISIILPNAVRVRFCSCFVRYHRGQYFNGILFIIIWNSIAHFEKARNENTVWNSAEWKMISAFAGWLLLENCVYRALGQMTALPFFHTGFFRINFYFAKKFPPRRHFSFPCGSLPIAYTGWQCIYVLYILLSYSKCSEAFHLGRRYIWNRKVKKKAEPKSLIGGSNANAGNRSEPASESMQCAQRVHVLVHIHTRSVYYRWTNIHSVECARNDNKI